MGGGTILIARLLADGVEMALAVQTGRGADAHPSLPRDQVPNVCEECRETGRILGIKRLHFHNLPQACLDYMLAWPANGAKQLTPRQW
jgi:hypothetical protein